jgi:hypothetical protein
MWNASTNDAVKMTYTVGYKSFNAIYENVIGTWNGSAAERAYGILTMDRLEGPDFCARSKYLGSIAYARNGDNLQGQGIWSNRWFDCMTLKDNVIFYDSNYASRRAVTLDNMSNTASRTGYTPGPTQYQNFTNNTRIGGTQAIGDEWSVTNYATGSTAGSVPNIWNGAGTNGARVCKRYVNGQLTNDPLWPWTMNQRIIDAMKAAGKTPVDVTKTMEAIFGPIPSECRTGSGFTTSTVVAVPPSPGNLSAGAIQ